MFITIMQAIRNAKDDTLDQFCKKRIEHYLWLIQEHGMHSDEAVEQTLIIYPYPPLR
jgi:hypothetical protein